MSNNKALCVYSNNDGYLYGVVVTINGTTIIAGTETQLSNKGYSGYNFDVCEVETNTFFISFSNSDGYLYGVVVTINGTTIIAGTETRLSTLTNSGYMYNRPSCEKIDENKIFVGYYAQNSGWKLYGVICIINGTTIITGSETQIYTSSNNTLVKLSVTKVETNKVFIAFSYGNNYYLYLLVCTINGTTITTGSVNTDFGISYYGYYINTILISDNKVLVVHSVDQNFNYLYGIVCIINGTTITSGTDTRISDGSYSSKNVSVYNKGSNIINIVYSKTYQYICERDILINNTTITLKNETILLNTSESARLVSSAFLNDNQKLIIHSDTSNSNYYKMKCFGVANIVKLIIATNQTICGVANTGGVTGNIIKVYTPIYS